MLKNKLPSRIHYLARFSAKVPFLTDLFLFVMRGHGLGRLKKKSGWSVVDFEQGAKGLDALKDLFNTSESIVKKSKHGRVKVYEVQEIGFSFQSKFMRVKGRVGMM